MRLSAACREHPDRLWAQAVNASGLPGGSPGGSAGRGGYSDPVDAESVHSASECGLAVGITLRHAMLGRGP